MNFTVPANYWVESKESEKKDKYLDLARGPKNYGHEGDSDINCNSCARYSHQKIDKRSEGLVNNKTSRDHPKYCIIKISQNTVESPRNLRRLAVSQTPVRNHHLTLEEKNYQNSEILLIIIIIIIIKTRKLKKCGTLKLPPCQ